MAYNPEIHHRRSIRLKGYDYSTAGAYFFTICAYGRECLFGEITDGVPRLNQCGEIIRSTWAGLPEYFPTITIDAWVIMPNHFHGIIMIRDHVADRHARCDTRAIVGAGSSRPFDKTKIQIMGKEIRGDGESEAGQTMGGKKSEGGDKEGGKTPPLRRHRPTIGQVVGYFKYQSTKRINMVRDNPSVPVWQRNYYERVLRDEDDLDAARQYIINNPLRWGLDADNSAIFRS